MQRTAAEALRVRGRRLEYATAAWNGLETVVTVAAGLRAHSLGLVAFGLDSAVEVFAGVVVLRHLSGPKPDAAALRRTLRRVAAAFLAVGVYLLADAAHGWLGRHRPSTSPVGLGFLAATVAVMVALGLAKRRTGTALGDRPLLANAGMTLLDSCVAAGTLVAVAASTVLGWTWADPLTAAAIALFALREGWEQWGDAGRLS